MSNTTNNLLPVWNKFPDLFAYDSAEVESSEIIKLISEILVVGDYYHFVIDIGTESIQHVHTNMLQLHGLIEPPENLSQILNLIHPKDIPYVLIAEEACHNKMAKLDITKTKNYKTSYCFRMRMADGTYKLFHHQSITIGTDPKGRITKTLNIHTDIEHITTKNNFVANVMGIHGLSDFYQFDLSNKILTELNNDNPLTNREQDILLHIANGLSSIQISQILGISDQTVRVHRKNILRKTNTFNSSSLIKKCLEMGWLS